MDNVDAINWSPQPDAGELGSKVTSLISISVMAALFGIKTYNVQYKYLTYSRWLVLILYQLSWAFTVSGVLFVSTNNYNYISCLLSELACDLFYSATKLVIYAWLIEKVWVVSSVRQSRWKTKSYRFHVLLMTPYVGILTLMIIFHIAEVEESGVCIIGLQPIASIPLMIYDFVFNFYFTVLFIKPLIKVGKSVQVDWRSSRLHEVALRTLAASIVCLLVSFANILTLVILNGRERGVLCLTCCTVDVTINVITIHWVTTHPAGKANKDQNNSISNHDSHSDGRQVPTAGSAPYKRQMDIYDLGIDDYIADPPMNAKHGAPAAIEPHSFNHALGGHQYGGTVGLHDQYGYGNGRFVMITEKEQDAGSESRPSSIQESQSSRKSLTKSINGP